MAKTLQQILGGRNLTGVIQGIRPGLPDDILPPALVKPGVTRSIKGDTGTYRKVEGTRKTARIAMYGSKSQQRNLSGVTEKSFKCLHSIENIQIKPDVLVNLESNDGSEQRLGEEEVAREVSEFRQLFDNTRVASVFSAFALGKVHFDSDGNLLPTSSSAAISVDYEIPSGNLGQLDVFGGGAIISASWATAGTKIAKHVQLLHKAARKKTGYKLEHALYGENIFDYFLSNTQLKEIIYRNNRFQDAFTTGEIPDGFLGIKKWWPAYQGFFEDQNGVLQDSFGVDTVTFIPEPDPTWWEWINGSYPVPTTIDLQPDASSALSTIVLQSGMFMYAVLTTDPVGIKMIAGDTFLPMIKVPGSVFIADVTP